MSSFVRAVVVGLRLVLGAVGALWAYAGVLGMIDALRDRAWGGALGGVLLALIGVAVAYGAFVAFPWERTRPSTR